MKATSSSSSSKAFFTSELVHLACSGCSARSAYLIVTLESYGGRISLWRTLSYTVIHISIVFTHLHTLNNMTKMTPFPFGNGKYKTIDIQLSRKAHPLEKINCTSINITTRPWPNHATKLEKKLFCGKSGGPLHHLHSMGCLQLLSLWWIYNKHSYTFTSLHQLKKKHCPTMVTCTTVNSDPRSLWSFLVIEALIESIIPSDWLSVDRF